MKTSQVRAINLEIVTDLKTGKQTKTILNIAEGTFEQVIKHIKNPKNDWRCHERPDCGLRFEIKFEPVV